MKIKILLGLMIGCLFAVPAHAQFPVKSAVVSYAVDGKATKMTITFDNYGKKSLFSMTAPGMPAVSYLMDGTQCFRLNYEKKEAIAEDCTFLSMPYVKELELLKEGFAPKGEEMILGKECRVFENKIGSARIYAWGDLRLKWEKSGAGATIVATAINEAPVPAETFMVPEGFSVLAP